MSNTKKHKDKGKFKQGILDYNKTDSSFQEWCDRKNNDFGEFRAKKKNKTEKILDKKMKEEIKNICFCG